MPLCIHSESTDPTIDIFDREAAFVESTLKPLHADLPDLKIIMEHITTKQGVEFVLNGGENIGGTITPQHLLYNRNSRSLSRTLIILRWRMLTSRPVGGRSETPFLLPPHPQARGASPSPSEGCPVGLQEIIPRNGFCSSCPRE